MDTTPGVIVNGVFVANAFIAVATELTKAIDAEIVTSERGCEGCKSKTMFVTTDMMYK